MSTTETPSPTVTRARTSVAIVGGGVAGLYAAYNLAQCESISVSVYEIRNEWGGRIETVPLDGYNAEFGPMRFELSLQPRLTALCNSTLGLQEDWDEFPPPSDDEVYRLLKKGVFKMFGRPLDDRPWLETLFSDDEAGLAGLRSTGRLHGRPRAELLYDMGFWNALSESLGHDEVIRIRDGGHFYHLIPDNPNALEWGIFWLRYFHLRPDEKMQTLKSGVRQITDQLVKRLKAQRDRVHMGLEQEVVAVTHGRDPYCVRLRVTDKSQPVHRSYEVEHDHVVFALPQVPLQRLIDKDAFPDVIREDVRSVIAFPLLKIFVVLDHPAWPDGCPAPQARADRVPTRELHYWQHPDPTKGVVLLYTDHPATEFWKPFVVGVTHDRAELNANDNLKRTLLRYLVTEASAPLDGTDGGPGVDLDPSVWPGIVDAFSNWLASGLRKRAMREMDPTARANFERRAAAMEHWRVKPNTLQEELAKKVSAYGIRDWSRDPFGAGCHAWKPRVKSWEVRRRLNSFGFVGRTDIENMHVCGEAYSDYQGFIEGALRSADAVVKEIRPNA